jgi:hypothetical protein
LNSRSCIAISVLIIVSGSCITQFIPEIKEDNDLLVVEGLITDQPGANSVRLTRSMAVGKSTELKPLRNCTVYISDDSGNKFILTESADTGTYITDKETFQGVVGRKYTLHINTNNLSANHYSYESIPMEMIPVPPIASLYYEKVVIKERDDFSGPADGCQVYIDTYDNCGLCKYYRWDYIETWEYQIPWPVKNQTCWITKSSEDILIKNNSILKEDVVNRFPITFISNQTDRLNIKYSILLNQYSVNPDEYAYWEKLKNMTQTIGGLYDITPAPVPNNIYCIEDPKEKVLGYFSVSAKTSKRIFINENFRGAVNLYKECIDDTIPDVMVLSPKTLNVDFWILDFIDRVNMLITYNKGCADCTTRGSTTRPDFWDDDLY